MDTFQTEILKGITFVNLSKDSKKPATPQIIINSNNPYLFYKRYGNFCQVIGFQDPETDLFICDEALYRRYFNSTDTKRTVMANDYFIKYIIKQISLTWKAKKLELKQLLSDDEDKYKEIYKPISKLNHEINTYLTYQHDLEQEISKQLRYSTNREIPPYNTKFIYHDSETRNNEQIYLNTQKSQYNTPSKTRRLTTQRQTVLDFMRVFADDDNIKKLAWYFGACFSNKDINDTNIQKMLIITSAKGGNGKSTLIHALCDALITPEYTVNLASFDQTFSKRSNFALNDLYPARMTIFDESNWCEDLTKDEHDFSGLYLDVIKSLITEGALRTEAKYSNAKRQLMPNFMIALSNYLPQVEQNNAMGRRILDVTLKPTTMYQKGRELGLTTYQAIVDYIKQNGQSFINTFVDFYQNNQSLYTSYVYDQKDSQKLITNDAKDLQEKQEHENNEIKKDLKSDYQKAFKQIEKQEDIDLSKLSQLIIEAKNDTNNKISNFIRLKDNHLYVTSNKDFIEMTTKNPQGRKIFKKYFGAAITKFKGRYYQIY